jgi:polyisoprenoid-binding protein YceI
VLGALAEEGRRFTIVGDLTIRGVTREVTLSATYEGRGRDPWGGERVSFTAETKIDRRDFGLTWNAALETGGLLVSNDVKLRLDVQAVRAA